MIKIGGVNIDVSHPKAFASNLESHNINMRYEYIFNDGFRSDEEVNWFINRFNLKSRAGSIEEMADKVDIGFIQSCNWEKHIDQAMPFISKGKPVFIDKPIVGSMKDIERIEKLVEEGAKILGSSSLRYSKEIKEFLSKPVEERGDIISIFGTSGVDEFNYSVHIVEAMSALAGAKGISCQYIGKGTDGDNAICEMYSIEYENGIRGVYYSHIGKWQPFHITVMTTKGTFSFVIDTNDLYRTLLEAVCDYMEGRNNVFSDIYTLTNCTKIMLCGKKSRDELNGTAVYLDNLTDNDKFDGYEFEKFYSHSQGIVYKD
ncbi:MAG TPA: Gfo/Idh/MocA family oxidoreductase [Clostridia bacterium]|nr:Gfo/Idh/MocA family oxidoreductase [Clostridia bacterium]HXK71188.1 Gfo/Idh/MocA family oxidoreductase [Clostridia bacterium]